MQHIRKFDLMRNGLILGPMIGFMVVSVVQAGLEGGELLNAGLVIVAAFIGGLVFLSGGSITAKDGDVTATLPPTAPPVDNWPDERDRLRLENAALKGQVQAMQVVFQYLDIRVTAKR